MGQKVNPHGLRVGVIKDWSSRWYAKDKDFGDTLVEDYNIRKYIKTTQYNTGISRIEIERFGEKIKKMCIRDSIGALLPTGAYNISPLPRSFSAPAISSIVLESI